MKGRVLVHGAGCSGPQLMWHAELVVNGPASSALGGSLREGLHRRDNPQSTAMVTS